MKKTFEAPKLEIIRFEEKDVIVTSTILGKESNETTFIHIG